MLKLIHCIDDLNWITNGKFKSFTDTLENKMILTDEQTISTILNHFKNTINVMLSKKKKTKLDNVQIISDFRIVVEYSKKQDVYVIGNNEITKLLEPFSDELLILKTTNKQQDITNINLNYFSLKQTSEYQDYLIEQYTSNKSKILFGNTIANEMKLDFLDEINELLVKYKKNPHLAILQIGNEYASNVYINNKIKLLEELNLDYTLIQFDEFVTEKEILKQIKKLNKDKNVNGILVQLPISDKFNKNLIMETIDPRKDVDCFNSQNIAKLYTNSNQDNLLLPCTSNGIINLLKYYKIDLNSKDVVIVGRSNLVSKPLVPLFLTENATVTICHSKTKNLKEITSKADIVVCAIGKENFFGKEYFNNNAIVIDVGINRDKNNKIVGDVKFREVLEKVKLITPVPNGVGLMTLMMLIQNLLTCFLIQHKKK